MARIAAPARLRKLLDLMARIYDRIGRAEAGEILPGAAENYDVWFRTEGIAAIEATQAVAVGGRWTADSPPESIPAAGRLVEEAAARYILAPVTDWTLQHFPEFWRAGHALWRLNREVVMLPTPKRINLLEPEINAIADYQRAEISAWQDHIARHRRHVERFVHSARVQGWTREMFLANMTAPDGHTVGFRYGNADLSWYEHLRRYTVGRPHMMAAAAVEWRMKNAPAGR